MKLKTFVYLSVFPRFITAILLDHSCYHDEKNQPHLMDPQTKLNFIEESYKKVFQHLDEMKDELAFNFKGVLENTEPYFENSFIDLMGEKRKTRRGANTKAGIGLSKAKALILKGGTSESPEFKGSFLETVKFGIEALTNLGKKSVVKRVEYPDPANAPPSSAHGISPAPAESDKKGKKVAGNEPGINVDPAEILVFCGLDHWKDDGQGNYVTTINKQQYRWTKQRYDNCLKGTALPGGANSVKATTYGKKGQYAKDHPNVPDIIHLCPAWLKKQAKRPNGLDDPESLSYPQAYAVQQDVIPDYKWPQTRATKNENKKMRFGKNNPNSQDKNLAQEIIPMDMAMYVRHTLGHELFHTGHCKGKLGSIDAEGMDDVPKPPPMQPYGWDNNIDNPKDKKVRANVLNADLWAYLMDVWFVITRFQLVPDILGILMEIKNIEKYELTAENPLSWKEIEAKIAGEATSAHKS